MSPLVIMPKRASSAKPEASAPGARTTDWRRHPAVLGSLGFVLIESALSFVSGTPTWSTAHWSLVSGWLRLLLFGVAVVLCVPSVAATVEGATARLRGSVPQSAMIAVILAAVPLTFRVGNHANGDGYFLISYLAEHDIASFFAQATTQASQTGDLLVHWLTDRAILSPMGFPGDSSYVIWGIIAALFGFWALARFGQATQKGRGARLFVVFGGLTAAPVYFWFGHVESYTLSTVAGLWACVLLVESFKARGRLRWAWVAFVLAVAFHAIAVCLLPMMVWGSLSADRRKSIALKLPSWAVFLAGFVLASVGAVTINAMGLEVFVPVLATAENAYSAFSFAHLVDTANALLRTAPLGVVALVAWLVGRGKTPSPTRSLRSVLAMGAAGMWYFTFWIDPELGAPRDWDLLAFFGFPLTLWAVTVIADWNPSGGALAAKWVPVAGLAVFHVGGLVAANQDPMAGAVALDRLLADDVHHSGEYKNGERLVAWSVVLEKSLQRYDLAVQNLERRAEFFPESPTTWVNLGNAYLRLQQRDKARGAFRNAVERDVGDVATWRTLSMLELVAGNWTAAREAADAVIYRDPRDVDAWYCGGVASAQLGEDSTAVDRLTRAIDLRPGFPQAIGHRARAQIRLGNLPGAIADLDAALRLNPNDADSRRLLDSCRAVAGPGAPAED